MEPSYKTISQPPRNKAMRRRQPLSERGTPKLSPEAEHVLPWFWALKSAAPAGFSSSIITFESIESWARLFNTNPLPWEVRAIRAMDSTFNATLAKKRG